MARSTATSGTGANFYGVGMRTVTGRLVVSLMLIGVCAGGSGCGRDDSDAGYTGFVSLPTCAEIEPALTATLREVVGDELYRASRHLITTRTDVESANVRVVGCRIVFEDPMPRGSMVPAAGPLSRTIDISVSIDRPIRTISTSVKPAVPASELDTTTPLPGVGDEALTWVGGAFLDADRAGAVAKIDNLQIDVGMSGMDWTGGDKVPVNHSRYLQADLRSSAQSLITVLAAEVPKALPRSTFDWTLPPLPTPLPAPAADAPITVWDPCTLADEVFAAAGLDPAAKQPGGFSVLESHKSCMWSQDGYLFTISAGQSGFLRAYYYPGFHETFTQITVNGRRSMSLPQVTSPEHSCNLVFDTPFGERNAAPVGAVEMEVSSWERRYTTREQLCDILFRIARPLAPHLPPERALT
ncbi:DUF3558 domain-containing protein [Nocardia yamanashiensis]|uniref:DUF3558 family protein n=1 Tax=Nocardia yamanashiensis TaxID=209247 RepID=UPI001E3A6CE3|nr:DUF3558 family protein [Nocardia yamanashiensis]UGT44046.1 DUF3558 domain-containing protein [Nocardia yamanashiensis]